MALSLKKIVSGGQTGVDRAALDAALAAGVPCGGWVPAGRIDENGRIPDRYPVNEMVRGGFLERTLSNVQDSDGTAVFYFGELEGGTEQTVKYCEQEGKPCLQIDGSQIPPDAAAEWVVRFADENGIAVLNVAGPRASKAPGAYAYVCEALKLVLTKVSRKV